MKRFALLAVLAMLWGAGMVRGAGAASVDEAEQEKIRLIVKQVLREYGSW